MRELLDGAGQRPPPGHSPTRADCTWLQVWKAGPLQSCHPRDFQPSSLSLAIRREKAMAPLSSTLAWQIPWMEEPGRLQSMGSLGVGHDWATSLSCIGEGNGNPLQCSCLENPRDSGAWWAAVYGVAQSQTWLKWLSSSSSQISSLRKKNWRDHSLEIWTK